jgi:hypothetical protein
MPGTSHNYTFMTVIDTVNHLWLTRIEIVPHTRASLID